MWRLRRELGRAIDVEACLFTKSHQNQPSLTAFCLVNGLPGPSYRAALSSLREHPTISTPLLMTGTLQSQGISRKELAHASECPVDCHRIRMNEHPESLSAETARE